ncbi:GNAT family N-acetyltransferase [Companilactobacillus insicii]|uniref:GNAT family N-acetyltransferase n=1 Tax=Companilactobacillus insicii TaxID=1732567 RepID=UPI000F7B20F3|nr:GNAT family N-acetyltransferase [Companilactobacillus insicii]
MIDYREATIGDLDEIAELETNAFFDYPLYWDVLRKRFKNDTEYRKFLKLILTIELAVDLRNSHGYVGILNDEIVSVALLESLDDRKITNWDFIKAGVLKLLPYFFKCRLWSYLQEMNRAESKSLESSDVPTWYLGILAISPKYQGRKLGTEMLQEYLFPLLRKKNVRRMTLMTNTVPNCQFYEKNGFSVSEHIKLRFGKQKVENWSFQRLL